MYRLAAKEYFKKLQTDEFSANNLIETEAGDARVEALICLWRTDRSGSLSKVQQQNFTISSKYKPSDYKNRLKLTLSNDKQYVMLAIDSEKPKEDGKVVEKQIQLLAWETKKLKRFEFPKKLIYNMSHIICLPNTKVVSTQLVGSCNYVMIKMIEVGEMK